MNSEEQQTKRKFHKIGICALIKYNSLNDTAGGFRSFLKLGNLYSIFPVPHDLDNISEHFKYTPSKAKTWTRFVLEFITNKLQ